MSKTCVIVSPYFPPSTLAGVHRARHLAKHLPAAGWTPIVLCVDEAYHEERLDPGLVRLVPASTEVVKVSAVSPRLTRPFGLGEISLRSFVSLRRKLTCLLETRSVHAVLITGSPYYPMLLAAEVKQRFGVPVVLDFQDPWVSGWGATQPRISKTGLSHGLATALEPRALRGASFVTSVSDTQNAQMAARYPWFDRERMAAIPIGSDPEDFNALDSTDENIGSYELELGCIHLSYVGTIWPPVVPTIRVFLRAVAALRSKYPKLYDRLRLNFVGTTANPNDVAGFRVLALAEAAGVENIVREIPQRIPYLDALSILLRSDATLMLGSDEPHYTASKIYPYLMSGKPYLSVFHRASSAHEILTAAGGGVALAFSTGEELAALEEVICDGLHRLVTEPETLGKADSAVYMPFEARAIAERYAAIFERLLSERKKP
ncbi:MAG: glycosyltransferase [Sulfuricellaceae bacterium]|nr:glycosyltransferase [Sulfuricellaceae bacterium]